jgi:peptidoglycan/LPS O-acetylase OafA/YrhL
MTYDEGYGRYADDEWVRGTVAALPPKAKTKATPAAEPQPDHGDEPPGSRRFTGVDGLRGLAVLTVLLYDTGWFAGARLGIDVLLVLSGFLVTLPLIRRADATGRTGAGPFLARRVKRLFPALVAVLSATLALCYGLGAPSTARDLSRQIPGALWPVSVTAQFCLAWPPLLALLCFLLRRRIAAVTTVVVLLLAGFAAAPLLPLPAGIAHAVTRSHSVALLAGAATACAVHLAHRAAAHRAGPRDGRGHAPATVLLSITGFAALAALAMAGAVASQVAVALCAALLTATLSTEHGPLVRLLSTSLLAELGRMSYSVYLLHVPVYWLLRHGQPGISDYALLLVGGTVTWFLSLLLHYLLVERLGTRPWQSRRAVR